MKRTLSLLLTLLLVLMISSTAVAEEARPKGIIKVTDVGSIEGSAFYVYLPAELEDPSPMVTPIIYVYGDAPYTDEQSALDMITANGLDTIAEAEKAVVIAVNPVGETWGKADVDAFEAFMKHIFFIGGELPLTYHTLQYMIGEGSGATFINNYMAAHCKRIAAVMTIGGEIDNPVRQLPLPAYIVSGSQEVVDYYLAINDGSSQVPSGRGADQIVEALQAQWQIDETDEKTTYTFAANDVKKVIVSKSAAVELNADLIADCWNSLFRYTARVCLTANFWDFAGPRYNDESFVLVNRPNYEAAGMEVERVDGIGNGIWEDAAENYWYEFVPAAVQSAAEGESFPLVVCLHGRGDHPMYEAEFDGWSQVCIDNNLIMVSPNGSGDDELLALVDYMIDKYPVDTSRIYICGFSAGGNNTKSLAIAAPERFAAIAPQSAPAGPGLEDLIAKLGDYGYDLDLPMLVAGQAYESESTSYGGVYRWVDALKTICEVNEIAFPEGDMDYAHYPYWGFDVQDNVRLYPQYGLNLWQGYLYDTNNVPMLSLMHSELQTHTHYMGYAPYIWAWMSQFARDTETGMITYTANK